MLCEHYEGRLLDTSTKVLILVLMEDALRVFIGRLTEWLNVVLILVLMEDALRVTREVRTEEVNKRLNPCSNGRCSASGNTLNNLTRIIES